MSIKKTDSNAFVILAIMFSFLTMIAIEASPKDKIYADQLNIEHDNYYSEYNDLKSRLTSIEEASRKNTLINDNTYSNAMMLSRDIRQLFDKYQMSSLSTRDVLLVDIGFNLSLFTEAVIKLENDLY